MIEPRELSLLVAEPEAKPLRVLPVPGATGVAARREAAQLPPEAQPQRIPHLWEPLAWGSGAFVVLMIAGVGGSEGGPEGLVGWHRALWTGLAALGLAGSVRAAAVGLMIQRRRRDWLRHLGLVQAFAAGFLSFFGSLIVLINAAGGFRRGRQLRKSGRLQLPPLGRGTGWLTIPSQASAAPGDAAAVAAQWRENGRTEHASVAAFARLTLDLLGLGAPARLLAQAQADGQDEIRHAELCFSLAKAIDGDDIGPVAFPAAAGARRLSRIRRLALVQLAIDSLVEGALHEGLSAAIIAKLAKACETAEIQPMLASIAEDEGRHAAHAWDVLQWCLEEGGLVVRAALDGALRALPKTMESAQPAAASGGAWVKYGIHDDGVEEEAYAKARASVVRRAESLLAA